MNPDSQQEKDLPRTRDQDALPTLSAEQGVVRKYLAAATSENTRRAYRSAIRQFEKCGGRLPADREAIVGYLLTKAPILNPRTLDLHLTAISQWHLYQGLYDPVSDPLVSKTMDGIRRTHGKPKRKAKALRLEHIAQMVGYIESLPESKKQRRDLALILVGFFGAFRRSELVALRYEDLAWEPEGLLVRLGHSKTDQEKVGQTRALPFGPSGCCPASALRVWIAIAGITEGSIFRPINRWDQVQQQSLSPGAVNELLKTLGSACQFDFVPDLSSHSFRRGLSTSAARERVDFNLIKKQGGWKSDATVWEYIEEGQRLSENASIPLMEKVSSMLVQLKQ